MKFARDFTFKEKQTNKPCLFEELEIVFFIIYI